MKSDFIPVLRFAICSDAHIEGVDAPGYRRLKKAIDYSLKLASEGKSYKKLDTFLIAGDITNKGTKAEFDSFKEIYGSAANKGLRLMCTVAKGHDSITMKKKSLSYFKSLTKQEPDFHRVIGGYHFIGLSTCKSLPHKHYSPFQKLWLKTQLKKAVADTPNKPVFLIHHEHVKNTVYGSSNFDGWGNRFFNGVFNKYPNVVDFSGHSHAPINDPRSVHQKYITSFNTGSFSYFELDEFDKIYSTIPTNKDISYVKCVVLKPQMAVSDRYIRVSGEGIDITLKLSKSFKDKMSVTLISDKMEKGQYYASIGTYEGEFDEIFKNGIE